MEYVLKLFPSAKFLVIIRNPVSHIASLIKQTRLFIDIEKGDPLLMDWTRIIGHREFGHAQVCINVGDTNLIHNIRKLWKNKQTYVKGWAHYWNSIYEYIANRLDVNEKLKNAVQIIRYQDICIFS